MATVSKKRLDELRVILREEFNLELDDKDLHKFGTFLVGYFNIVLKIYVKEKYGQSPDVA